MQDLIRGCGEQHPRRDLGAQDRPYLSSFRSGVVSVQDTADTGRIERAWPIIGQYRPHLVMGCIVENLVFWPHRSSIRILLSTVQSIMVMWPIPAGGTVTHVEETSRCAAPKGLPGLPGQHIGHDANPHTTAREAAERAASSDREKFGTDPDKPFPRRSGVGAPETPDFGQYRPDFILATVSPDGSPGTQNNARKPTTTT